MCCKLEYDKPSVQLIYQAKSGSALVSVGLVDGLAHALVPTNPAERPSSARPGGARAVSGG